MKQRLAFVALTAAVLLSAGAFAACPIAPLNPKHHVKKHASTDPCPVDLNLLPQVSQHIVANEPAAPLKAAPRALDQTFYTGPTVGLSKPEPGVRPAPTVGYKWSLD